MITITKITAFEFALECDRYGWNDGSTHPENMQNAWEEVGKMLGLTPRYASSSHNDYRWEEAVEDRLHPENDGQTIRLEWLDGTDALGKVEDTRDFIDPRVTVIVTRHEGLVEWLSRQGITGTVIAHATADDVRDKIVVGVLPLNLAAEAAEVINVDMPGLTPEQRGKDLTPAEMDAAGAKMAHYRVTRLL